MEKRKSSAREHTTLRMPEELKQKLQSEADRKGISLNELIMFIFDDYVNSDQLKK